MELGDLKARVMRCVGKEAFTSGKVRVCDDSRQVRKGDIFAAVCGVHVDGHAYIDQAVSRGARIVVSQRPAAVPEGVELLLTEDSASALGMLAQANQGNPSENMLTLGVTGTNGKTTVAYLTRAMMEAGGKGCGLIGTVCYDVGDGALRHADNTTPGAVLLADLMGQMRQNGLQAVAMECSSHALDQRRTEGIHFTGAAFTNLTGDHLDYHHTPEAYLAAKGRLFAGLSGDAVAVLNKQDPAWETLAKLTAARVWRYGIDDTSCEIHAAIGEFGIGGTTMRLTLLGQSLECRTRLVGRHNVSNILAAAGLAYAAQTPLEAIGRAAESFIGVPGRLEAVDAGQDFAVLVDYAHTDDALANVLRALRELQPRRVILVFGCGGDRDRTKRPRMAKVAESMADAIVVTNDNPRTEEPGQIFADIRAGFSAAALQTITEIPDRREAIEYALRQADSGDVVLIAGKGHEDYQLVQGKRLDFDDRKAAREILEKMK